ncbi:MAG: preprotein translocase subunit SecE [Ruminococcaceae bacterium]|nr:preprotein translocase subunit SecE [Oscillospiraceae bacterium]
MAENEKLEAKTAEKKPAKKDKPSLGSKIGKFWREYRSELKKVVWATRESTIKNTLLVAVAVIIVGACIGLLDFAFSNGILALGKLVG